MGRHTGMGNLSCPDTALEAGSSLFVALLQALLPLTCPSSPWLWQGLLQMSDTCWKLQNLSVMDELTLFSQVPGKSD